MKKYLLTLATLLLITLGAKAQKLTVVDSDGNGIHLVTVLTEDGNMIGVTDLSGTLLDVKGAAKVVLTHVAYKSKLVDMSALQGGKARDYYFVTVTDEGKGRQRVSNPEGTVGFIETKKDEVHMTLDAGKMQMYRNKRLGQNWQLKGREKAEYAYEFNEVFNLDGDGNATIADLVMSSDHWEWNGGKGRMKFIIETYAVEHAYIDAKDFKEKKKGLKKMYASPMKLDALEAYATSHGIPALTPSLRKVIEKLPKKS
jgi:hypothetical protein